MNKIALLQNHVRRVVCPPCGSSDKYGKIYNEDMICQGGCDLGQNCTKRYYVKILAQLKL